MCLELVVESAMELARRGGDRKQAKVWKEKEALANIELITHILNFFLTINIVFLKCSHFEDFNVIKHWPLTLK